MGKILIIKTLILPKFIFLASSCVVAKMCIKEIESCSCFYRFIWKGKPDKIKRLTLIGDYEKGGGGVNMVDINSYFKSLKVSWVKRLLSSKISNWKVIARKYLDKFGEIWLIFKMNIDNCKSIENFNDIPEFYKEIINCCVEFGGGQTKTPTNFREIRNQNIWGNKYIKLNNKRLIYKNWIDSNLLYVNDITDENGRVSQDYLIEKLKNKIIFFSEFSRLKKAIPKG